MAHVRNTLGTPRWPPGTIPYPLHGACAVRGRRRPCATCRAHRLSHRTCVIYVDSKGKRKSLSMKASMKAAARTRIRAVMEERLPFVDQSTTTVEPYPKLGKVQGWQVTHRCSCSASKGLQAKAHCGKTSTVRATTFWARVITGCGDEADATCVVEDGSGEQMTVKRAQLRERKWHTVASVGVTGDRKHDSCLMSGNRSTQRKQVTFHSTCGRCRF